MQNYKYDKAIVPDSKNGGSPALNNNPRKGGSKRALLIGLDLFCLFMGEPSPAVPRPLGARRAPQPARVPARWGLGDSPRRAALSAREAPRSLLGEPSRPVWSPGPRPPASRRLPGLHTGFRRQLGNGRCGFAPFGIGDGG